MKKKIFITGILLIICSTVWAQNSRLDSLLAVIEKTADPEKINIAANALNAVPQGNIGLLKKGRQDLDAIKEKIMQPFFTTKPTGEGTGLGLSLTYDIVVKGHGGKLEIDSKEGEYSIFIVSLPIN